MSNIIRFFKIIFHVRQWNEQRSLLILIISLFIETVN